MDMMDLETLVFNRVERKNTIVLKTEKNEYHLLLRWKNHQGILNCAWQVSIRQHKKVKTKAPKEPKVKVPKEPKIKVPKEPKIKVPKEPKIKVPKEPKVKVPKEPKVKADKDKDSNTKSI
jgi:hypothetical protein